MTDRNYKYSSNSKRLIRSVGIDIQDVCIRAMRIANSRMMFTPDFGISSGLRTVEEQEALYAIGRTVDTDKPTVTECDGRVKLSRHQSGNAVDVFCYVDGKTNYEANNMALVATCFFEAAMQLNVTLRWGGNWKFSTDSPHFEITPK